MLYVGILLGIVVLLLLVALVKTLLTPTLKSTYVADEPEEVSLPLAEKLSKMVQCDTTSFEGQKDPARWEAFHRVLQELFPLVHEKLEVTDIDGNQVTVSNDITKAAADFATVITVDDQGNIK